MVKSLKTVVQRDGTSHEKRTFYVFFVVSSARVWDGNPVFGISRAGENMQGETLDIVLQSTVVP